MQPKITPLRMSLRLAAVAAVLLLAPGAARRHVPAAAPAAAGPAATTPPGTAPDATGAAPADSGPGDNVAAIVNDQVISEYDLQQRTGLFAATSGQQPTGENIQRIRTQVLQQLVTERLELAEAQKNSITVSSSDVDKAIDDLLKGNNLTLDQLKAMLARGSVDMRTFRAQITAQIAWQKLVSQEQGDRVHIAPEDVDAELKRIAEGANKPHFMVSEIFLPVDSPEQDGKVLKDAQNLVDQIQMGAPFAEVARQFSQNPSAAQGGDIGIIQDGQLSPELNDALEKLSAGRSSQPIKSAGGYYILQLRARQEAMGTKIPEIPKAPANGIIPLARILLPIGPKPSQDLAQKAMHAGEVIRSRITTCDQIPALVKQLNGAIYQNLGSMRLTDLSPQIQQALAQTKPGESTPPFLSPAGLEIFARCDIAAPQVTAFKMPTRDQVEEQLFEEQITALARQYLRDLKRNAEVQICTQGCSAPTVAPANNASN